MVRLNLLRWTGMLTHSFVQVLYKPPLLGQDVDQIRYCESIWAPQLNLTESWQLICYGSDEIILEYFPQISFFIWLGIQLSSHLEYLFTFYYVILTTDDILPHWMKRITENLLWPSAGMILVSIASYKKKTPDWEKTQLSPSQFMLHLITVYLYRQALSLNDSALSGIFSQWKILSR